MITREAYQSQDGREFTWIDVEGGSVDEISDIARQFGLHPIEVETILEGGERPRVQDFENHVFIVLQTITRMNGELEFGELEVALSKDWLLIFHKDPLREITELRKVIGSGSRATSQGTDFLFYNIVSRMLDAYFALADNYQARIDSLEEAVSQPRPRPILPQMLQLRRDVVASRRIISYTREVVATLLREDFYDLKDQDERYYRDAHFQLSHLLETVETYREFLADLRDAYLSAVSLNLNEVMKKLTVVGTMALPLIVVSGIYGMNVDLPWKDHPATGPVLIVLMALFIVATSAYFRMIDWL